MSVNKEQWCLLEGKLIKGGKTNERTTRKNRIEVSL
jgi:hypothetical protein